MPCECDGRQRGHRKRRTVFDSLATYCNNMSSECAGLARDFAMVEGPNCGRCPVRFMTGTLGFVFLVVEGGDPCAGTISTNSHFFETMSKRRSGFPSETKVKRGMRIVHGDKLLEEKLGRNDLSLWQRTTLQEMLPEKGPLLMGSIATTTFRDEE